MPRKADTARAIVADLYCRAAVRRLNLDAQELAQLVRPPQRQVIPPGPTGRRLLMRMLISERRRSEKLLELMVR